MQTHKMQITIPIKQVHNEKDELGAGAWDRKCHLGVWPALEFWGRHDYFMELHHPQKYSNIPPAVQLGHGDMHLDYWLEPDELIGTAEADEIGLFGGAEAVGAGQHERKPVFEVKLNVSDYKPKELNVRLSEDRVLSIEGDHHDPHHDGGDDVDDAVAERCRHGHGHGHLDSLYAHFRRSVTLPRTVIERQIECYLSSDGQQLVVTAPVLPRPPRTHDTRYHGHSCSQDSQCPNLTKCECMIAEDRRG